MNLFASKVTELVPIILNEKIPILPRLKKNFTGLKIRLIIQRIS